MRKLFLVVFLSAFVGAVGARASQQKDTSSAKPSTITGCVAQSGGVYRLDHATVATDQDVDTQNRPATEANPTPKTISYTLVGGDVKAHLGHKVEVTGTISTGTKSKDVAEMKSAPGMKLVGTLTVKSVKMISNACP